MCVCVCVCVCVLSYINEEVTLFGPFRTSGLVVLLLLEAYMGWSFVSYLLSRRGDTTGDTQAKVKQPTRKNKETKTSEKKKN